MVPKILHYIWIGPYEDPLNCRATWIPIMSNYKLQVWDNNSSIHYIKKSIDMLGGIKNVEGKSYTYLSDLMRLLILKDHGGIYLDHDFLILKNFDCLIKNDLTLTFQYKNEGIEPKKFTKGKSLSEIVETEYRDILFNYATVNNCFIATSANNFFIDMAIDLTLKNHFASKEEQFGMSDWGVGPEIFTRVAEGLGFDIASCVTQKIGKVTILNHTALHPIHGIQRTLNGLEYYESMIEAAKASEDTYAIHLHNHFGVDMFMKKENIPLSEWYNNVTKNIT
jgi:hypothetical protein